MAAGAGAVVATMADIPFTDTAVVPTVDVGMLAEPADTQVELTPSPVAEPVDMLVAEPADLVAAERTSPAEVAASTVEAVPAAAADVAKPIKVADGYPSG